MTQRDGHLDSFFYRNSLINGEHLKTKEYKFLFLLRTFNVAYILTKFHNDGLNLKRLAIIAFIQTNGRTDEVKTGPDFISQLIHIHFMELFL